jgi:signal transduction histidine kinase
MQGAKAGVGKRRRANVWGHGDPDADYRGSRGVAASACLVVLATAAIVSGPLASRASIVNIFIGVGIGIAALLGARALHVQFRQEAAVRREIADAATARERCRIARDLHDGLAQDLAFIAAHGDRLAIEKGADHPLAVAARRALTVSRGAIAELSAPQAPTTGDALRKIADELGSRFDVRIDVHAEAPAGMAITPSDRENIVRIAREAIVNAARHGRARNVVVSLTREENGIVLRVRDDGIGGAGAAAGLGS